MAITYSAGTGTLITSHIFNETLGNQSQQSGNNTVVVSDTIANAGNGQEGDGTTGIGNSFVGRLIIIDLGLSTEQRRMCIADVAGTTTTRILTVHEDWDTNPVITTDTIHVPYEAADIEDGTASGGIGYAARTGLFTYSNDLTIQNGGGLQIMDGTGWEMDDAGSAITFFHQSGGYLYSGYEAGGAYLNGGEILFVNNVATEPSYQAASGALGYIYDLLWWAQLVAMQLEHANGSGLEHYGVKFLNFSNELHLYDQNLTDCKVYGKGATTEIVRVDAGTVCNGLVLSNVDTLQGSATADTKTLSNVIFSGVTDLITLINSDVFNMIDPVWAATLFSDFNDTAVTTTATINDKRSVIATVQKADGTKLQNALVIVHEETQLADLVVEAVTDVDGKVNDAFTYKAHIWTTGAGATTTYGAHALRIDKWGYLPFVADQVSTEKVSGSYTIGLDSNVVETVQATAITNGSGIVWNEDTNPSELFDFTLGSGTLAVGMIITFSPSGAVGTITESKSGDSVAGEIHLKDRNATAIGATDTFSRTGGTAGTFSGTYTNGTKQPFSIWIEGNNKTYQQQHDYWAARTSETTLNAIGEIAHEWGRGQQARVLYRVGTDFSTEMSNSKGIIVINGGAGTVGHFTDDANNTWIPPITVPITVIVRDENTQALIDDALVYMEADTGGSLPVGTVIIAPEVTGVDGEVSATISAGGQPFVGMVADASGQAHVAKPISGTIPTAGLTLNVTMIPE